MSTGFSSSSSNKVFKNKTIDIYLFNQIINDAWLNNSFNSMENCPMDFSEQYICSVMEKSSVNDDFIVNWKAWKNNFITSFESFGCKIKE